MRRAIFLSGAIKLSLSVRKRLNFFSEPILGFFLKLGRCEAVEKRLGIVSSDILSPNIDFNNIRHSWGCLSMGWGVVLSRSVSRDETS